MGSVLLSATNVPPEVLREIIENCNKSPEVEITEPPIVFEGQITLFELSFI